LKIISIPHEPGQQRKKVGRADPFLEDKGGGDGDEKRRGEEQRHRVRHRHGRKAKVIGGVGHEVQEAPRQHPAPVRRGDRGQAPVKPEHDDQQQRNGGQAADDHRLIQRIVAGQELQDHVLQGKDCDPYDKGKYSATGG
jgi:hypothetical protein